MAEQKPSWQNLSLEEREREYSPSSCIGGDYRPFLAAYSTLSRQSHADALAAGGEWRRISYGVKVGIKSSHGIDICLPKRVSSTVKTSLLIFIHGGYWQELSAHDSLFAAAGCITNGHAFAAIDYTLAPSASVAEIVQECRAALLFLMKQAGELGFDASRIVLAGSSAGAHLVAMAAMAAMATDLKKQVPYPHPISACVLVSGIYDLQPLVGTSINDALGLTLETAQNVSPTQLALNNFPKRIMICYGDNETTEFKRQSAEFADLLNRAGVNCSTFEIPERNHFDVIFDLANDQTQLGKHTLALLKL
jgi:arylformamidase